MSEGLKWVWSVCFETSEWRRDGLDCVMMKGMKRRRVEMEEITLTEEMEQELSNGKGEETNE